MENRLCFVQFLHPGGEAPVPHSASDSVKDSDADEIADDRPLIEVEALRAQSAEGRVGTPQSSVATLTRTPSL